MAKRPKPQQMIRGRVADIDGKILCPRVYKLVSYKTCRSKCYYCVGGMSTFAFKGNMEPSTRKPVRIYSINCNCPNTNNPGG